jgi:ribosomal-protein-alanine N-acetyltransferase
MSDLPVFMTERLRLQILNDLSAADVLDYLYRNRHFHQPWFASRSDEIFSLEQQKINLRKEYNDFLSGRALPLWISLHDRPDYIIGKFSLTDIILGCFRSATASWHLDQTRQNQGIAFEAGKAVINAAFEDFRLHRIEANIMPSNSKSIRLAESLGFALAGYENRFLKINDQWEDHFHYVLLSDGDYYMNDDLPRFGNERLTIRPVLPCDIKQIVRYFTENADYLEAFNPALSSELQSESFWRRQLVKARLYWESGRLVNLGIFLADRPDTLIGCIEIRDILKAPYNCCEIGYSIDRNLTGRGYMMEALALVLGWLFNNLSIQRVHARYIPGNYRSEKLLEILGFKQEGLQRNAIQSADGRRDLVLAGLLAEEFVWIE